MLGPITRFFLRHLLVLLWLLLTLPLPLLYIWLVRPLMGAGTDVLGLLLALAWIFGSWWLGETTARHMVGESDLFLPALRHTVRDLRLRFARLPLVGRWFESGSNENKEQSRD